VRGVLQGPRVSRLRSSRPWISLRGPKSQRSITLVFRLSERGLVKFTIRQTSPVCRRIGSFFVRANPGRNTVHFRGRMRGRMLPPGTYRIEADAAGNRRVMRTVVVITPGRPSRVELAAARRHSACGALAFAVFRPDFTPSSDAVAGGSTGARGSSVGNGKGSGVLAAQRSASDRPSRSGITSALPPDDAVPIALVVALALAFFVLFVSVLPRAAITHPRAAAFLTENRPLIAAGGFAAIIGFAIAYLLG
jgi:hypothetical protein